VPLGDDSILVGRRWGPNAEPTGEIVQRLGGPEVEALLEQCVAKLQPHGFAHRHAVVVRTDAEGQRRT
jgi:hypothetical protein